MSINLLTRAAKGSPLSSTDYDNNLALVQAEINSKGAINGFASLGATGLVPIAQLATGTPTGSKFVRDDGTLAAVAGGSNRSAINVSVAGGINLAGADVVFVFLLAGSDPTYTNASFTGQAVGQLVHIYNRHAATNKTLSTGLKTVGAGAIVLAPNDLVTFTSDGSILVQTAGQLVGVAGVP